MACCPTTTSVNSLNGSGSPVTLQAPDYSTVFNVCVPYWFSPWGCCSATAFQMSVVNEQQRGCGGEWWLWSRGQWAEIFPDSFTGILSQYIQRDPSAGSLQQHLQLVLMACPSSRFLQSGAVLSIHSPATAGGSLPVSCMAMVTMSH